ncbi:carboxypeptidase-like regulatory domain-containing protein [Fimbriiglobus ruber]|uniref:Uncharacterized protein n=1 Tax=Fimbriiglobus ruber TaxID=1908690 RepID=A0A225D4P9_9BACT|nr:carboxypeptidase-like regulatory domain-containing protein [Fimbriiglobus ruber]OWK36472.1 hypothetical protein FRUB_09035 [Fimbriiglobus ruber]
MTVGIRFLIGVCAAALASTAPAQPPAPTASPAPKSLPTLVDLDKAALDILKDIHDRGAKFYNDGDSPGCYRLYQGALITVRPFIAHRPLIQKFIEDGLNEVATSDSPKAQAFRLHEIIEQARGELKSEIKKAQAPKTEPAPKEILKDKPKEAPKDKPKTTPKEELPDEIVKDKPKPAPTTDVKPLPNVTLATDKPKDPAPPVPVPDKPKDVTPVVPPKDAPKEAPKDVAGGQLSGTVSYQGKPLSGADVTVVTTDQKEPRVFTAKTGDDGKYQFAKPLPAAKYVVFITPADAKAIPERFQSAGTSGLVLTVTGGPSTLDIDLK